MDEIRTEPYGLRREAEDLWTSCAENLRGLVNDATYRTWFEGIRPAALHDHRLVLMVPSSLAKERIAGRYLDDLRRALSSAAGPGYEVVLEVRTDPDASERDLGAEADRGLPAQPAWARRRRRGDEDLLSPAYTFEAFVIGESNRFAHAAALSVAETPAKSYNPLFIYGGAGLGKTHLLHAIGHYVHQNYPDMYVRYVSMEAFTNDFIDAIRTNATAGFKRRYRECDVLLVDDIQFLENKEGTQEEFFHTFNSLHGARKQIVISSDRPPRSIATLEDRLRSRFEWGLITDVQPPEFETRLAILRKKAQGEHADVPSDVLDYIASHVTDNIRELEGALTRVYAKASVCQLPLTVDLADEALRDIFGSQGPRQVTPQLILETAAAMFGFSVEELQGKSRRRPLVNARQIGMYVFRELTNYSYPAIGREFGGRDHTTVIHACDKIRALMPERKTTFEQVTELTQRIKSGG